MLIIHIQSYSFIVLQRKDNFQKIKDSFYFSSPLVSPQISTMIPLIRLAICHHFFTTMSSDELKKGKKAPYGQGEIFEIDFIDEILKNNVFVFLIDKSQAST